MEILLFYPEFIQNGFTDHPLNSVRFDCEMTNIYNFMDGYRHWVKNMKSLVSFTPRQKIGFWPMFTPTQSTGLKCRLDTQKYFDILKIYQNNQIY